MPVIRLSTRKGRSSEQKTALVNAVFEALKEALRLPPHDRTCILQEYAQEDFHIPPGKSNAYLLIEISMFAGRTKETKKAIMQMVADRLAAIGLDRLDLAIILNEQPLDNWGIRGGQQASEVDLGFKVDI